MTPSAVTASPATLASPARPAAMVRLTSSARATAAGVDASPRRGSADAAGRGAVAAAAALVLVAVAVAPVAAGSVRLATPAGVDEAATGVKPSGNGVPVPEAVVVPFAPVPAVVERSAGAGVVASAIRFGVAGIASGAGSAEPETVVAAVTEADAAGVSFAVPEFGADASAVPVEPAPDPDGIPAVCPSVTAADGIDTSDGSVGELRFGAVGVGPVDAFGIDAVGIDAPGIRTTASLAASRSASGVGPGSGPWSGVLSGD